MTNILQELTEEDIPNFSAVAEAGKPPFLFRGGQPTEQGFVKLKNELKVNTVACLRHWNTDWQKDVLVNLNIDYVYMPIPLKLNEISDAELVEAVRTFFNIIRTGKRNIYVHCHQGIDRTGLMVALYRICFCDWNFDDTYAEMQKCGYQGLLHEQYLSVFKDTIFDWWANKRCGSV